MEKYFPMIGDLVSNMVIEVLTSYSHNWLPLLIAALTAAIMTVHVNNDKLSNFLLKKTRISVFAAVLFGALTPLCACGTMAVLLGMVTTALPWSPIMAFLTSSPLMSPDGFVMNAGIIGFQFAVALTIASIVIGLGSGLVTSTIERKTNFLKNQSRFDGKTKPASACGCGTTNETVNVNTCSCSTPEPTPAQGCSCGTNTVPEVQSCGCGTTTATAQTCCSNIQAPVVDRGLIGKLKLGKVWKAVVDIGFKQILLYFTIFIALGYLVNRFIPTDLIVNLFGAKKFYAVPLASAIGIPIYINTEASIAIVQSFIKGGASGGSVLAFMITGPGTSAMVIAGLATFMRKRALALYVGLIFFGGIICGYLYDLLIATGLVGLK